MNRFKIASQEAHKMVQTRLNEAMMLAQYHTIDGNQDLFIKWVSVAAHLAAILEKFEKVQNETRN